MILKKQLQIANGIAFVSTVIVNYLSNTGLLNGKTIGKVSDSYNSLFTPAGYTFSIWGLIYLLLFAFVVYQGRSLWNKNVKQDDFILKTGWWFVLSCVCNILWVFAWIYEYTGISCAIIALLLVALLKIVVQNRMELDDKPISIIAFLWWPFVIYSGWVTVATIANISSYLTKVGWDGFGISNATWAILMICVAVVINSAMIWKRNMREFAVVGAWALIGIGVANANGFESVTYTAYAGALFLLISAAIHGFRNRKTNPFKKLQQYLNSN